MISYPLSYQITNVISQVIEPGYGGGEFFGAAEAFNFTPTIPGTNPQTPLYGSPLVFSRGTNATQYRSGDAWAIYGPNNNLLYSNTFTNVIWQNNAGSFLPGQLDPFGGNNAWFRIPDATSSSHSFIQDFAFVAGQTYTSSIYAKSGGLGGFLWVRVALPSAAFGTASQAWFNVGSANPSIGTTTNCIPTITPVGNGYYRVSITAVATITATAGAGYVPTSGDGTNNYTGDGVRGVYFYGAQINPGPYTLDYNETAATAYYGPRFDTNPSNLSARGLLYEPSVTNLLVYGNELSNAAWTKAGSATITPNASIGATGIVDMDLVTEATTSDAVSQAATVTPSTLYTYTADLKRGNTDWVRIFMYDNAISADQARAWVNLATGAIGTVAASGATTSVSARSVALPNGIYRVSVSGIINGTVTSLRASVRSASANGSTTGAPGATYYVGRNQLELGNETSYTPTFAATATRSGDSETFDATGIFNDVEGTIYCEIELDPATVGLDTRFFSFTDTTSNNRLQLYRKNDNSIGVLSVSGGVANPISGVSIGAVGGIFKIAMSYTNGGTYRIAVNGVLNGAPIAFVSPVGVIRGYFSPTNGGSNGPYWHRKFAYYRTAMSATQLQAMTT